MNQMNECIQAYVIQKNVPRENDTVDIPSIILSAMSIGLYKIWNSHQTKLQITAFTLTISYIDFTLQWKSRKHETKQYFANSDWLG